MKDKGIKSRGWDNNHPNLGEFYTPDRQIMATFATETDQTIQNNNNNKLTNSQ